MTFTTPPESPGEQYALAVCLAGLASIMVALRFFSVRRHKVPFGHDDTWIIVALFFTWATAIDNIIGAALGLEGRHATLSPEGVPELTPKYVVFLKTIYVNQLTQVLAVGPTKLSVLFFYRRIFKFSGYWFTFVSWAMIGLVIAWTITFFFANLLECIPISQAWVSQVGGSGNPHCIDAIPMYLAQQYFDVIMDGIILAIPMPLIWTLQLPAKKKFGVVCIFGVGILTIGASCAKLVVMEFVGTEISQNADISYYLTPIMYWPMIEASLGITAACMPKMAALFVGGGMFNVFFSQVFTRLQSFSQSFSLFSSTSRATRSGSADFTFKAEQKNSAETSKASNRRAEWTKDDYWGGAVNESYTGQFDSDSLGEHRKMDLADEENSVFVERVYGTSTSHSNV